MVIVADGPGADDGNPDRVGSRVCWHGRKKGGKERGEPIEPGLVSQIDGPLPAGVYKLSIGEPEAHNWRHRICLPRHRLAPIIACWQRICGNRPARGADFASGDVGRVKSFARTANTGSAAGLLR